MSDNKKQKGKQDRIRVDKNDPEEIEYLQRKFPGLSHNWIVDAIRKAGPFRKNIVGFLRKNYEVHW